MASLRTRLKSITGLLTEGRLTLFWLFLIILLAAGLRFCDLGGKSLWFDEIRTAICSQQSIPAFTECKSSMVHPPLYFILIHFFMYLGKSDFMIRLPSAIFGVLSIPVIYGLGKLLWRKEEGLIGAFLLSISAYHIWYSQEARMYTLFVFLSLLSLYLLYRAMEKNDRQLWFGFTISAVLNLYTIYVAFFVLASEVMLASLVLIASRLPNFKKVILTDLPLAARSSTGDWRQQHLGRGRFPSPSFSSKFSMLFLSVAAIGILYLPWLSTLVRFVSRETGSIEETDIPQRGFGLSVSFLSDLLSEYGAGGGIALYVFVGAFLLGFLACIYQRQWKQALLVLLWTSIPFIILSLVKAKHSFALRYVIFLLPIYLMVIAKGITSGSQLICQLTSREINFRVPPLGISLAMAVIVFGSLSMAPIQEYYRSPKADYKAASHLLENNVQPSDAVVLLEGAFSGALLWYYDDEFKNLVPMPESFSWLQDISFKHERIWIVGHRYDFVRLPLPIRNWVSHNFFEIPFKRVPVFYKSKHTTAVTPDEEIDLLEEAADLSSPRIASLYFKLGDSYKARVDFHHAIEAYQTALALEPALDQRAGFHLRLARAYEESGRREEAIAEYERVLELQPNNAAARQALDALCQ